MRSLDRNVFTIRTGNDGLGITLFHLARQFHRREGRARSRVDAPGGNDTVKHRRQ